MIANLEAVWTLAELNRIARFLLATAPWSAEGRFEAGRRYEEYAAAGGDVRGRWLRYEGGAAGYIWVGPDGADGEFVRRLPDGVQDADCVTLAVDPAPTHLRDLARALRDRLAALPLGPGSRAADAARGWVDAVERCYDPGYEAGVFREFARRAPPAALSADAAEALGDEFAEELTRGHAARAVPGQTLAVFRLLWGVCRAVRESPRFAGRGELRRPAFARYFGTFASAAGTANRDDLCRLMLHKAYREGYVDELSTLAGGLKERGVAALEAGMATEEPEPFYDHLSRAVPDLLAAHLIYSFLADAPDLPAGRRAEYQQEAVKATEERIVRIMTSLLNGVKDVRGGRMAHYHADVAAARGRGGKRAEAQRLTELIELHYYYPRAFRRLLVEGAGSVPA